MGPGGREASLGYLVSDTLRLMRRDFARRAVGLKLTPALARLLFQVDRAPGARQADLAGRLEVTPVTLGRMLDRLVARGYVTRVADAGDRRAQRVYLAPPGEALMGQLELVRRETEARATAGLEADAITALCALLRRVQANLIDGET